MRLLELLGPLDWAHLPERNLVRNWGHATVPHAAFIAACLIKINEDKNSMGKLLDYFADQPELVWLCGLAELPASDAITEATGKHLLPPALLPAAQHNRQRRR